MIRDCLRIGSHIEYFSLAHTGQMTGRHIPHGIGAGLSGGKADFCQSPHDTRYILQLYEVHLNILSCRDVADSGRIAVGEFRHTSQLIRRDAAERDLDADHLHPTLTLAVNVLLPGGQSRHAVRPVNVFQTAHSLLVQPRVFNRNGNLVSHRLQYLHFILGEGVAIFTLYVHRADDGIAHPKRDR